MENGSSSCGGMTGLLAVIAALEPGSLADGGIVLGTPFANRRGRAREFGAETTRLEIVTLTPPEWPNPFGEHFGEAFDAPLCGCIGARPTGPIRPPTEENCRI
jgi:hypothetical protein